MHHRYPPRTLGSFLLLSALTAGCGDHETPGQASDSHGSQGGATAGIGGSNAAGAMADAGTGGSADDAGDAGQTTGKTYNVGSRTLTFVDSTRGRTLATAIWYPTSDGTPGASGEITGATPDPSGGPYPLILFSHGWQSYNRQSSFLMAQWARHGFVVAAPDHQYDTYYDYDPSYDAEMQFDRPEDIRFVTDQMLSLNQDPTSFLYGMTDPNAIGMSGHSFGGHTTMMIAGAPPNLDHLAEYCQSDPDCNWDICCLQDQIQQLFPGQRVIDESDPRTKAALAMAPDGYGWLQADGMAKIKIPIMIMGGGQDTLCPLDTEQEPMYEGIVSTKYLLVLKNADHYAYIDLCSQYSTSDCTTLHAQIAATSTDFWIRHLRNDSAYGANLQSYVASQPDIDLSSNIVE